MVDSEKVPKLPKEEIKRIALAGEIILVSSYGFELLEQQIQQTRDDYDSLTRKMGEVAREDPDLPENTEFKEIKTKLQFELPRRMDDLLRKKVKAIPFSEEAQEGLIGFGTSFKAKVDYPGQSEEGQFVLLGPIEAAVKGDYMGSNVISYLSPMGRALWGVSIKGNQEVVFDTPGGKVKCTITKILQ